MVTPTAFQLLVAGRCKEPNLYISCPRKKPQRRRILTRQTKPVSSWSVHLHLCRMMEVYLLAFQGCVRRVYRGGMLCVTVVRMREVPFVHLQRVPVLLFPG